MVNLAEFIFNYVSPILAVIILVLNSAEIYFIFQQKVRIKYSAIAYIFNLAISDIFVGVAVVTVKIFYHVWKSNYSHTIWLLFFVSRYYLLRVSLFASVFNLMAMTLLRWLAIRYPIKHRSFIRKYTTKMCVLIWALSFLVVTCLYCGLYFKLDHAQLDRYEVIIFPIIVYPTSALFVFSYYHMRKLSIKKQEKNRQRKTNQLSDHVRKYYRNNTKKHSFEDKVHRFAIRSTIAFIMCWMPLSTYGLAKFFNASDGWNNMRDLEFSLFTLAFINSVIDPILYFLSTPRRRMRQCNGRISPGSETEDRAVFQEVKTKLPMPYSMTL